MTKIEWILNFEFKKKMNIFNLLSILIFVLFAYADESITEVSVKNDVCADECDPSGCPVPNSECLAGLVKVN